MQWKKLNRLQSKELYAMAVKSNDTSALRRLCQEDLFFLILYACKRRDMDHDWIYARCREVEANPDGYLDLWAREHYKSTIITFGLTIQDILKNPEETFGIFSHTRPIAKSFLSQIKRELEENTFLKNLFPDILYQEPTKDSPCWSLDNGIVVKRKSNPKEATIEAWGLVDGQPTSKHFSKLVYDDVVTKESVSTPEMIVKVTDSWALSLNLGSKDCKRRTIGTRYHASDTYRVMMDRGSVKVRMYPATEDGTLEGRPVFMTQQQLDDKRRDMGSYVFSSQMLQNPLADNAMGFREEWLMYYSSVKYTGWNFYILVDSASEKKKTSDYTAIGVIGLAPDGNYYLVDGVRDRLNLTERTKWLFKLVRKWQPMNVGYEKYGLNSDIEHIKYVMELENYRFPIVELGGSMPKNDRIRRLVPIFEQKRFYLPHRLVFISYENKAVDFVRVLIDEEYLTFPVSGHDDAMDMISRICDEELAAVFPRVEEAIPLAVPRSQDQVDPFNLNKQLNVEDHKPLETKTWREAMAR